MAVNEFELHQQWKKACKAAQLDIAGKDDMFYSRLVANGKNVVALFQSLYGSHPAGQPAEEKLLALLIQAHRNRSQALQQQDRDKTAAGTWFTSQRLVGMSLYVDRFCGKLEAFPEKIPYLKKLGVNFIHFMPLLESPVGESDGGYAVSHFRRIDPRFGQLSDFQHCLDSWRAEGGYAMMDIVLNHTSHQHEWAQKAKAKDPVYSDYFYFFPNREEPDQYEAQMPEIFPEAAPGSFTYVPERNEWVMTVFHQYQWDLNYRNPAVFIDMLENIFFYANLGIDVLRIDAPAFIWKEKGTACQNLPQAHDLLRLIKACVHIATPGMAILGEAIVAPREIMKYFGTGDFRGKECDLAYNATQMALQWDALATGDTRVMLAAQPVLLEKPLGNSWITYTRCHDDIGLGFEDSSIQAAGFDPYAHRKFLKDYYAGFLPYSTARGALFSVNPRTQDARISGSLAALCGLEAALAMDPEHPKERNAAIATAVRKILLMQAMSFFIGGIPMLFYGDEWGALNDYSFLQDPGKAYDNRWMHRPLVNWKKLARIDHPETAEAQIFTGTQNLIRLRKKMAPLADHSNLVWLTPHNIHVAGFVRENEKECCYALFNFSPAAAFLTWYAFKEKTRPAKTLKEHWSGQVHEVGPDNEYFVLGPYQFALLSVTEWA